LNTRRYWGACEASLVAQNTSRRPFGRRSRRPFWLGTFHLAPAECSQVLTPARTSETIHLGSKRTRFLTCRPSKPVTNTGAVLVATLLGTRVGRTSAGALPECVTSTRFGSGRIPADNGVLRSASSRFTFTSNSARVSGPFGYILKPTGTARTVE
jgi:hypothetical protein